MTMDTANATATSDQPLLLGPAAGEASGELAPLYRAAEQVFGYLPNAARLYGISPTLLANQLKHIAFFVDHETLSPALLAFIRLLVSDKGRCRYCVDMNVAILQQFGVLPEAIDAARRDPREAPLAERERALLAFVTSATANPHAVGEREMAELRGLGWSDREIFEAMHHGAYTLATDTLFDTFNVVSD